MQSGEKITKLEDLQDIDELHVVEVSQQYYVGGCDIKPHRPSGRAFEAGVTSLLYAVQGSQPSVALQNGSATVSQPGGWHLQKFWALPHRKAGC